VFRNFVVLLVVVVTSAAAADISAADGVSGARVNCQRDGEACSLDVHAAMRSTGFQHAAQPLITSEQQFYRWLAECRVRYQPIGGGLPHTAGPGAWYSAPCASALGIVNPTGSPLLWIPDGAPQASALVVAQTAEQKLKLPPPVMMSSPGSDPDTPKIVNLPTWAWLPQSAWAPITATASVPGVSVTATATPQYVGWSWGDGSFSACRGRGTAYVRGVSDPAAVSPDCGHTYTRTSKNADGLRFQVSATIHWRITWRATTGQSGQFADMTSRAAQLWPVEEIDALNVPGVQAR
jgi:hypothetical protein